MSLHIEFDYHMDGDTPMVRLYAEAILNVISKIYHIHGISLRRIRNVLPDIFIRKEKGRWVHIDSLRESRLSRAIGNTLDKLLTLGSRI
jgi:hypothetical protein